MEKENWEKAHEFWVLALKKDPEDEEAIEGKRVAEHEITNKKLVQLRNLINAGKAQQAVDLTWELEKLHKEWGYSNSHAISQFHDKQIKRLYPQFIGLLKTTNYQNFPIKKFILITRFEPVFSKKDLTELRNLKSEAIGQGKSRCLKLKKKNRKDTPFYKDVTERYCQVFNDSANQADYRNPFIESLYKKTKIRLNVGGLSRDFHDNVKTIVLEYLEKTPYLNNKGKKILKIDINGSINEYIRSRRERRYKSYQAKEKKKVIENGKEKFVTKNVTRSYPYRVRITSRTLKVDLNLKMNIKGKRIVIPLTDNIKSEIVNHNYRVEFAGLYPKRQEFEPVSEVMNRVFTTFSEKVEKKLNNNWKNMYCDGDLLRSISLATEEVMKCRMLLKKNEKYSIWLKQNFGLENLDDQKDFEILIGLN